MPESPLRRAAPANTCVFRARATAEVWSVTRDGLFYGDYLSRAEALGGACAAARDVEALGGAAEVRAGPDDTLVPHARRAPKPTTPAAPPRAARRRP